MPGKTKSILKSGKSREKDVLGENEQNLNLLPSERLSTIVGRLIDVESIHDQGMQIKNCIYYFQQILHEIFILSKLALTLFFSQIPLNFYFFGNKIKIYFFFESSI